METISLKMEKNLLKDLDLSLKENRYSTRTEFIREAIRNKLSDLEKQRAIRGLKKTSKKHERRNKTFDT